MSSNLSRIAAFASAAVLSISASVVAQELVVATAHDYTYSGATGDPIVVIGDLASGLPQPQLVYIAPSGNGSSPFLKPHALALFSANIALASHLSNDAGGNGSIDVIDTVQAQRVDHFTVPGYENDGYGTFAINPARTYLLIFSGFSSNKLFVVSAPFSASSIVSTVQMPGQGGTAQTHAIVFDDATGRAYVGDRSGISALDPPYASIAFTIPLPGAGGGTVLGRAVALSADGDTLASTIYADAEVQVLHAPFSAASLPTALTVPGALWLDGLAFTPDGTKLLVVDALVPGAQALAAPWTGLSNGMANVPAYAAGSRNAAPATAGIPQVFAISAPFDVNAPIETLAAGPSQMEGFEDIDISADGEFAALSGGTQSAAGPLVVLRAPFTAAGVTSYPIYIPPLNGGYDSLGGRGAGTARFWSAPIVAPPQISTDTLVSATEGDSGTSPLTFHVLLSRASTQSVTVDFATGDGSLTAPSRYLATSGTVTFAPGETRKLVSVPIVGNTFADGGGYFWVYFSNPVNASLLDIAARVHCDVFDNDDAFLITNPSPLPDGFVGAPYSLAFTTAGSPGGTLSWFAMPPSGLTLDPVTGVLGGVPTAAGRYFFSVLVSTGMANTGRGYQLTIGSDRIFADDFE
jgi:Calx-beta domain-containing protein/putative Ig domain-containing protein